MSNKLGNLLNVPIKQRKYDESIIYFLKYLGVSENCSTFAPRALTALLPFL